MSFRIVLNHPYHNNKSIPNGYMATNCMISPGITADAQLLLLKIISSARLLNKIVRRYTGRIRLSVSTVNRTYELSGITHVTPFRKYGKHSTGTSTYGPWVRTYSKLFSCKPVLTVCSCRAQSNEIWMYGRVSRGSIPRVRRYGLLYLRTVEYDNCFSAVAEHDLQH